MTVSPFQPPVDEPVAHREDAVVGPQLVMTPAYDIEQILASIDTMAAQRPVAAQIVSVTNSDDTSAKALSRVLATDVALASRVMKLANSAYFGMRGRVTSLQFAVTVVGFPTVRTMATVALTELDDESRLPEDFWTVTTSLALAASSMAPRFGERPQDGLCIGLLAQMGAALLHHNDPDGYRVLAAEHPTFAGRRRAEVRRYGISAVRLTSVALENWGFPSTMVLPMQRIEDLGSLEGGLLRCGYEAAARLTVPSYERQPIGPISCGRLREEDLPPVLYQVREDAEELRRAILGD
jgi:HD-like signal output (HDOD) protein